MLPTPTETTSVVREWCGEEQKIYLNRTTSGNLGEVLKMICEGVMTLTKEPEEFSDI
jgi:hypothetical protein